MLLHKALAAAVAGDPGALDALEGARRSFGWNLLGNLLELGQIAFAPATPEVLRCAPWLLRVGGRGGGAGHAAVPEMEGWGGGGR